MRTNVDAAMLENCSLANSSVRSRFVVNSVANGPSVEHGPGTTASSSNMSQEINAISDFNWLFMAGTAQLLRS